MTKITIKPLSVSQRSVVSKLKEVNATTLERRTGGYWTYPDCPPHNGIKHPVKIHEIPAWYFGTNTIKSLVKIGVMREIEFQQSGGLKFAVKVELV